MAKVVHVHLMVGKHEGRKDFYFSSISAIYTVLTAEEGRRNQELSAARRAWWKWYGNDETRCN